MELFFLFFIFFMFLFFRHGTTEIFFWSLLSVLDRFHFISKVVILCADCMPLYCPTHNTDCSFRAHNSNCNGENLQCCVYFHQLSSPAEIPKSMSHILLKESCMKYNCKVYYKQHVKAIQLCCSFHHLKRQNNCIHNFSLQGFHLRYLGNTVKPVVTGAWSRAVGSDTALPAGRSCFNARCCHWNFSLT